MCCHPERAFRAKDLNLRVLFALSIEWPASLRYLRCPPNPLSQRREAARPSSHRDPDNTTPTRSHPERALRAKDLNLRVLFGLSLEESVSRSPLPLPARRSRVHCGEGGWPLCNLRRELFYLQKKTARNPIRAAQTSFRLPIADNR
jgi:hypothetical protein